MKIITSLFLTCLLMGMLACSEKSKYRSDADKAIKQIKVSDMDGKAIDLVYCGKAVFINVWASWCKPCIEEMPSIKNAQTALHGKNIEFLFASNEGKERIESFEAKRKLGLRYVQLENLEELQIQALPVTYVLNGNGEVVFEEAGYRRWDEPANIELLTKIIEGNE